MVIFRFELNTDEILKNMNVSSFEDLAYMGFTEAEYVEITRLLPEKNFLKHHTLNLLLKKDTEHIGIEVDSKREDYCTLSEIYETRYKAAVQNKVTKKLYEKTSEKEVLNLLTTLIKDMSIDYAGIRWYLNSNNNRNVVVKYDIDYKEIIKEIKLINKKSKAEISK